MNFLGSIIFFFLLFNFIYAQKNVLVSEVLSTVDLVCDDPFPIWYKSPGVLIGENNLENEHHKIEITGSRPNRKRHLIIKKLNSTDVGHRVYYDNDRYSECSFDIHLYG